MEILNKIKSKLDNIIYLFYQNKFLKIKKITCGYLSPAVYKEIYNYSIKSEPGIMIDIGPAQGGSSISLGLGIRDSNKSHNSKVYSIEKGVGSRALQSRNDLDLNSKTLSTNLNKYNLSDINIILMGDVKDVYQDVDQSQPISLMFIDADGALDRDFKLFYNRLLPNASIIIDDYINKINNLAKNGYLRWNQSQLDEYIEQKGAEHFIDLCPLGKEYTTYQFLEYFINKGLIKKSKVIGTTFFGYKTIDGVFDENTHGKELQSIRQKILEKYYQLNPNFSNVK
ncbi:MAG: hypothetical protein QNJ70_15485 [Xenococcaceae cyanobacterium MO_207.B15]|nr:hypothetical protein [Xenococcaceae cyanobacterium MO_207.B15]